MSWGEFCGEWHQPPVRKFLHLVPEGFRLDFRRTLLIPKKRQLLEETLMDDKGIKRPAIGADLRRNLEGITKGGSHV